MEFPLLPLPGSPFLASNHTIDAVTAAIYTGSLDLMPARRDGGKAAKHVRASISQAVRAATLSGGVLGACPPAISGPARVPDVCAVHGG